MTPKELSILRLKVDIAKDKLYQVQVGIRPYDVVSGVLADRVEEALTAVGRVQDAFEALPR